MSPSPNVRSNALFARPPPQKSDTEGTERGPLRQLPPFPLPAFANFLPDLPEPAAWEFFPNPRSCPLRQLKVWAPSLYFPTRLPPPWAPRSTSPTGPKSPPPLSSWCSCFLFLHVPCRPLFDGTPPPFLICTVVPRSPPPPAEIAWTCKISCGPGIFPLLLATLAVLVFPES